LPLHGGAEGCRGNKTDGVVVKNICLSGCASQGAAGFPAFRDAVIKRGGDKFKRWTFAVRVFWPRGFAAVRYRINNISMRILQTDGPPPA